MHSNLLIPIFCLLLFVLKNSKFKMTINVIGRLETVGERSEKANRRQGRPHRTWSILGLGVRHSFLDMHMHNHGENSCSSCGKAWQCRAQPGTLHSHLRVTEHLLSIMVAAPTALLRIVVGKFLQRHF